VVIPKCAQENEADYEAELVAVIGENCKDVTPEEALKYVVGYTIGNDVSARKWQRNPERAGGVPQWCYAKVRAGARTRRYIHIWTLGVDTFRALTSSRRWGLASSLQR
jgi:2-keto-4-pentenoate hydratase/2-oxohepta-3-ene-1,7-dioic acid hydratase in catechol pathway